jgi:hypothetical protein
VWKRAYKKERVTMTVLIYAQSKDRKTLADKLVAYSNLPRQEAENFASSAGPGPYVPLPLMDSSAILKGLPEETQRTFRHRSKMLEEAISWAYPLAIEEELLEGGLLTTWLSEAAMECPRGTIAIQRKTTLGEVVFLNQEFTFDIDSQKLVDNRPDYSPEALAGVKAEEFAFSWATLGLDIAKSLLGTVAGRIGSAIFARLFPPSVPSYFEQVYQEFREIVRQEIEENTIRLLVGDVVAVQTQMSAYAQHRRAGNQVPAQQALLEAWNRSVLVTSKLRTSYPVAGLGPFLTAGGLHLAIIQECALRDPEVNDPNDSSWAKIYVDTAGNFSSYVGSQPDKIVSERAAQITPVAFTERWSGGGRNGPFDRSFWWFEDRGWPLRREMPRTSGWTLQRAQDQRINHYQKVIVPLTNALAPAKVTAHHWRVAGDTPLPQVKT